MPSENRRHDKVPCNLRPEGGLKIVGSVAGIESWRSLWDWLLASEPPTKPSAKESEVTDDDSQGSHTNPRPSQEHNEEG